MSQVGDEHKTVPVLQGQQPRKEEETGRTRLQGQELRVIQRSSNKQREEGEMGCSGKGSRQV